MSISFPDESPEYRAARDRLLKQEVELRRATEAVAATRRALPPGGVVPQDYVFQQAGPDGTPTDVRFSELFVPGKDTLAVYNFMFPRALDEDLPCPSCTSFLDAFDGAALHITQRVNLVVVAKAELSRILAPLKPVQDQVVVVSGLYHKNAGATAGDSGGDHGRSPTVFLSGHCLAQSHVFFGRTSAEVGYSGAA